MRSFGQSDGDKNPDLTLCASTRACEHKSLCTSCSLDISKLKKATPNRPSSAARSAMEYAIDYAKKRRAFGSKISNFEAIQFKIAAMYQKVETARLPVAELGPAVEAEALRLDSRPFAEQAWAWGIAPVS